MKLSSAVVVLSLTSSASAYSVSRSSIRNLGQKSVQATGPQRSNGSTMKMEGTFFFNTKFFNNKVQYIVGVFININRAFTGEC